MVQSETRRLSRFVDTILDLSALEAGRFPLDLQPLPVDEIAIKVRMRFSKAEGRNRLIFLLPDGLPKVMADEQALESVLFHLFDNAIKYAPKGEINVEAWSEAEKVHVAVTDTGPGIPA